MIKEISFTRYATQATELACLHWQETEAHFSGSPPDLDMAVYAALENAGCLKTFAAFDKNHQIIGYVTGFITRHPHYNRIDMRHDLLFVHPAHRKGRLGLKLIAALEQAAAEAGAQSIMWTAKPDSTFSCLLQRTGATIEETVYRKEITPCQQQYPSFQP